ncbi:MAG: hypothetical protein A2385_09245 [Bdellovibrionales bacterium RIFOXYB1_FULL_39_21]|nr:MAG: hypothetical protein A2385_09245 [Bdellovibrionales bacterium RIFOXYB1_FULL_39_21]OFZ45117.1 MAG: hypothetical protein A2485_05295 [Bdellovibrionales bacterium RIFOXYC12_FULL_39_17]
MSEDGLKKHFIPLLENQKVEALEFIAKRRINIFVWEKGHAQKDSFTPYRFNEDKSQLFVVPADKDVSLKTRDIVFNFELNQIFYFGTGAISSIGDDTFLLEVSEELYKTEKRKNFRIFTNKVDAFVLDFENKRFYGDSLSTGGIGIFVTEAQQKMFELGKVYGPAQLHFAEAKFEIPLFRPLYIRKNHNDAAVLGINFLNVSDETEARLFREVNKFLYADFSR